MNTPHSARSLYQNRVSNSVPHPRPWFFGTYGDFPGYSKIFYSTLPSKKFLSLPTSSKTAIIAGFYILSIFRFHAELLRHSTFPKREYLTSRFFTFNFVNERFASSRSCKSIQIRRSSGESTFPSQVTAITLCNAFLPLNRSTNRIQKTPAIPPIPPNSTSRARHNFHCLRLKSPAISNISTNFHSRIFPNRPLSSWPSNSVASHRSRLLGCAVPKPLPEVL